MKMPSREEQNIAEKYVLERDLERPDTDIKKAIISISIYLLSCFIISLVLLDLFSRLGIFAFFPESIKLYKSEHNILFSLFFVGSVYILIGFFCLKKAAIGCIKLYQHYAPEEIRRRCLFKPTCSEYAILAIEKYGLIIGLVKAYIRLFKKCRGNIYRIDYP